MKTLHLAIFVCALAGTAVAQDGPMPRKVSRDTTPARALPEPPVAKVPANVPPAVALDVSSRLINALIERREYRVRPTRDVILDEPVNGISHIAGIVQARLVPDAERASFDIFFTGTSRSNAVSVHEPIKAQTFTVTNFQVHQPISIDATGVRGYCPLAVAQASTALQNLTTLSGDPDSAVIGIARAQFREDKFEIEWNIARHSECRLVREYGAEMRPQLQKGDQSGRAFLAAVDRLGVPTQRQRWSTTNCYLHVEAGRIFAAPVTSPPAVAAPADVSLRIHQSVLEHVAQVNLPGKSYHVFDVAKLNDRIVKLLNTNPKRKTPPVLDLSGFEFLLNRFGLKPVAITFAEKDPVSVQFAGGEAIVTLHGSGFTQGEKTFPARDIRARYRLEHKDEFALVRQGSVEIITPPNAPKEIELPDPDPDPFALDAPDPTDGLKSALVTNFNLFLPARVKLPQISLPVDELVLVPCHAELKDGWFVLEWALKVEGRP